MFNKGQHYVLDVQNGDLRDEKMYCIWNGSDFVPLKDVLITDPPILAGEPLNNKVQINSVREMS